MINFTIPKSELLNSSKSGIESIRIRPIKRFKIFSLFIDIVLSYGIIYYR